MNAPLNSTPRAVDTPAAVSPEPLERVTAGARRPWLVADIGGTNARFAYVGPGRMLPEHVMTLPVAQYAGPAQAAQDYLARLAAQCTHTGSVYTPPRAAAFALATAVGADRVELTNAGWVFARHDLAALLGLDTLLLLNDFEALALSLPRLSAGQLRSIGPVPAAQAVRGVGSAGGITVHPINPGTQPSGNLAVVGPGTGLGVAGLVRDPRGGWIALPGEGGHATLAPGNDFESDLLTAVRQHHPHVSAERLLSGIGLPVLYQGVADVLGQRVASLDAQTVVDGALSGRDVVAQRSVDVFCALLGSFSGNVALTLGARGGLFIGGGIVPRLGERFFQSEFRARFEAKGRFRGYLEGVPTALITDTLAALSGTVMALEQKAVS
jgi:glucokinase